MEKKANRACDQQISVPPMWGKLFFAEERGENILYIGTKDFKRGVLIDLEVDPFKFFFPWPPGSIFIIQFAMDPPDPFPSHSSEHYSTNR